MAWTSGIQINVGCNVILYHHYMSMCIPHFASLGFHMVSIYSATWAAVTSIALDRIFLRVSGYLIPRVMWTTRFRNECKSTSSVAGNATDMACKLDDCHIFVIRWMHLHSITRNFNELIYGPSWTILRHIIKNGCGVTIAANTCRRCGVVGSTLTFRSIIWVRIQASLIFTSWSISLQQAEIIGEVLTGRFSSSTAVVHSALATLRGGRLNRVAAYQW